MNFRVEILLGQPLQPVLGQVQFYGEVSQLQVFQNQLDPNVVSSLSKSCIPVPGTGRPWLELQANIKGDLEVNEPSICRGMRCPAGYKGHDCSIKIDKSLPVVTRCPSNFRVVSSNRLSLVNWTEPTFFDDVGVVNVIQTHRSGNHGSIPVLTVQGLESWNVIKHIVNTSTLYIYVHVYVWNAERFLDFSLFCFRRSDM